MIEAMNIPEKSHFKLNEVCTIAGVKPYVLRFWESEFEEISPTVSSSGQKLYEHKDIEAVAYIKKLLFEDKLTVEAAKYELSRCLSTAEPPEIPDSSQELATEVFEESSSACDQPSEFSMNDFEREKLLVAKKQLGQLLAMAESLQKRHNWY